MLKKSLFGFSGAALVSILMVGCSSTNSSSSHQGPAVNSNQSAVSANLGDLQNKHFQLRQSLSFAQAYRHNAETVMGEDVVRLSRYFENQREVDGQSLAATDSYCELYVETSGSDSTSAISFPAGQKLLLAQVSQATSNSTYSFTLALQAGMFQDVMVNCQNVPNSAGLDAQVGEILEITDVAVSPTPSSVGDFGKRIQFFQEHGASKFGITFSDGADAVWGMNGTFRGGDLQDQADVTAIAWRLWDASNATYVNDWVAGDAPGQASATGLPVTVVAELTDESEILHAVRADRSLLLLIAVNGDVNATLAQSKPSRYVDLGVLCQSRPTGFSDVSGETALVGCR